MAVTYKPYFDPDFGSLIERINPPRVCIDNDTSPDCTLVKVDSVNKQGMLLEMVQVLTDLDLVIAKSYISSDGCWLMDVFHVTDQQGNKITEQRLLRCIQEGICTSWSVSRQAQTEDGPEDGCCQKVRAGRTAIEMTGTDRPGLMSEISAVLTELGCNISSAVAWTHNRRAVCIIYIEDNSSNGPLTDPCRAAYVQAQLDNVVEAHHYRDEPRSLRLTALATSRAHAERRLHQMMATNGDYKGCCSCHDDGNDDAYEGWWKGRHIRCNATHVKIEHCKESGYSIVSVRSADRPKLLFDTLCALMDLQYVVSHAAIVSRDSVAFQEYYLRNKNGGTLDSDSERCKVVRFLVAATQRRLPQGLRLDISAKNRRGLLSDVTRVLREQSLSITRVEIGTRGERAVGTFYVKDTSEQTVKPETLEMLRRELGDSVVVGSKSSSEARHEATFPRRSGRGTIEAPPKLTFSSLLWSQLERLSNNFRPIKS